MRGGPGPHDVPVTRRSEVVQIDPTDPPPEPIRRAAAVLRAGGLVAFPTETVYGLGAHARDRGAVEAIFRAKGRPSTDPLIVHVPTVAAARDVVADWPPLAGRLAEAFWPGPLTMVLPRGSDVPPEVAAGRATVAVRIPAHGVALALLAEAGVPVAAPSANRFGRVSPTTARHVVEELEGEFDLLLDAGPTTLGVESTVVDLTREVPEMLRPGGVTLEDLTAVIGEVRHRERAVTAPDEAASAPGELLRHYSPRTPMALVDGGGHLAEQLRRTLAARGVRVEVLDLPGDATEAARRLYATLRAADASGAELLLAPSFDPAGLGRAVNDRLYRAAHGRVVLDAAPGTVDRLEAAARRERPDGPTSGDHSVH